LYPIHGCIIATFITKTWLSIPMWYTNSFVFLALSPYVRNLRIQKYLHAAGLSIGVVASFNIIALFTVSLDSRCRNDLSRHSSVSEMAQFDREHTTSY